MKKTLVLLLLIGGCSFTATAQLDNNWAIGLRVGEPLGLNVRKYFQEGDKAFDVNIGTYGFLYGRNRRYNRGEYKSSGLMIQGIYSWIVNPFGSDWLFVNYGFGGQVNNRNHYPDDRVGQRDDKEKKLSLGPTAAGGVEVKLPNNDLAVFLDGGAYMEILPSPLFWNWQVSGGVRLDIGGGGSGLRNNIPIRRKRRTRETDNRL